jgi:hypothetical protein
MAKKWFLYRHIYVYIYISIDINGKPFNISIYIGQMVNIYENNPTEFTYNGKIVSI